LIAPSENLDADSISWIWNGPVVVGRVANVIMDDQYDCDYACRVEQVSFTWISYQESIPIAYDAAKYPDEKPVWAYFRFDTVGVENDPKLLIFTSCNCSNHNRLEAFIDTKPPRMQ
jgi:polar amino acid transport system substrate-binding protein